MMNITTVSFPGLGIEEISFSRVAFSLFGKDIYWYGVIICAAILVAIGVATYFCKVNKYDVEMPINIAFVIVPSGILFARLFSVIFEDGLSLADFFNFRTGGMSIIGAVIGGAIGLTIYVLVKKEKNPLLYFDTLAVVLILAQAIGRWGNFFNGEVYGQLVDPNSAWCFFPLVVKVNGMFYQALFFYECVLNLVGFFVLALVYIISKKQGLPTAIYLIYYGAVRTVLEGFRNEAYILRLGAVPISQVFSVIMIAAGVALLVYLIVKSKKMKVSNEQKK